MKRICVFSFYDQKGIVDSYVEFLLQELSTVSDYIIVVVNGYVTDNAQKILERYSNRLMIRENTGYDAGAYAYVFKNIDQFELSKYDELILCNDTFFGPFESFGNIFKVMDEKACDFWGLNGYFNTVFSHIQSYFIVFRKSIIDEKLVESYFYNNIDEKTLELNKVYCQFEVGLFDFLTRINGKKYSIYSSEGDMCIYRNSFFYLNSHNLPIVKKKSFSNINEDIDNIYLSLNYIKNKTNYDVNLILSCIKRIYKIDINIEEIDNLHGVSKPEKVYAPRAVHSDLEIEDFCKKSEFYIYGAGMYAAKAFWRYGKENERFKGFIVSDGKRRENELFDKRIYEYSEISGGRRILLGLGPQFALEIYDLLSCDNEVFRIF